MPSAYVLLNTEIGTKNLVLRALKRIDGVKEAYNLWGVYDIIVSVKADSVEKLKFIITSSIEKISGINSKLTMIITENSTPLLEERFFLEQNPMAQ